MGKLGYNLDHSRGTKVVKGDPIFPRLEMEEEIEFIKDQNARKCTSSRRKKEEKVEEIPEVDEITIDDFMKVDLRVAEVIAS